LVGVNAFNMGGLQQMAQQSLVCYSWHKFMFVCIGHLTL
jgi:hypothetical protein